MLTGMEIHEIPARLRRMNRSQAELARHLDLDPSSMTKTIKGSRRIQSAEILKIEEFFGEKLEVPPADQPRQRAAPRQPAGRIPVYGYAAAGGSERVAFSDDRVLEWREPPPFWNGSGDLVYVRIIGDSMERRYFSGEIVPVRLGVPPAKNEDCLIEFNDGSVLIKNYGGQRDQTIFARQYNPEQELKIAGAEVRAIHAVWRPSLV